LAVFKPGGESIIIKERSPVAVIPMKASSRSSPAGLRAYLPAPLIRAWAADAARDPVWGEWIAGSLMHCDVTGFTAMSERLAERGKEGAEIMAAVLNRFFERMLGIASSWGGEQMKFGGDAMLLLFSGAENAARSAACALEMQRTMAEFKAVRAAGESHALRMRIGIHSGSFFGASVGDPNNLLHFLLLGPDVNHAAAVEPVASPGQIAVSEPTAGELAGTARLFPVKDGIWRVSRLLRTVSRPPDRTAGPLPSVVRRYLHPILAERAAQPTALLGEHRRVTIVFINVLGLSPLLANGREGQALAEADAYLRAVLDSLGSHGGFLVGSDASDQGDKLIIVFGAPVSQTDPARNALEFSLDLNERLIASGLSLRHRIGVNTGFVFAGEIGPSSRREYTVIGDAVNTAARLMSAAHLGEIVASEETALAARGDIAVRMMRPLKVKGKTAPVRACRVSRAAGAVPATGPESTIIGRDIEIASLLRLARRVSKGRSAWAYVSGEVGIGKSRLLRELEARLRTGGWRVLTGQCNAHSSHVPFGMWTGVLRAIFEVRFGHGVAELAASVEALATGHGAAASLIGGIVSLVPDRATVPGPRDERGGRKMISDAVVAAITRAVSTHPIALLVEDAHWIDPASLRLLADVVARVDTRLLLLVSSREQIVPAALREARREHAVTLRPLAAEHAARLVDMFGDVDAGQREAVLGKAGGNPLLLSAFSQSTKLGGHLPETVEDAIMSRVDLLPRALKDVVRVASVIGSTFEEAIVDELTDLSRGAARGTSLNQLVQLGLARQHPDQRGLYSFSHGVVRDVVYETLPYSQRRRWHGRIIQYYENSGDGHLESVCELLLHHAGGAQDPARTVRYACMSGERAAGIFAGNEAINYYQRALSALPERDRTAVADRSLLLERVGDSLETMGKHREAAGYYQESLETWSEVPLNQRPKFILAASLGLARPAALARKTAVSLERAADFEESLRWLDRALAELPSGKPRLGAQICAAKSVALFRKGLYPQGIEWGRRALAMAAKSRDRRQTAYSHNMLANSYMEHGDLRRAVGHLRRAVRIYHDIGDFPGQASANNNLGMCYHLQGVLDAALYHYQVALQTDQRVGDLVDATIVRSNIGEALVTVGRTEEAIGYLDDVIQAHAKGGELTGVAGLAHLNLSRAHLARGDIQAADRSLRSASRLLKRAGQQGLLVETHLQRAELLLASGHVPAAARVARRALRKARILQAGLLEARGERIVGEALALSGREREAMPRLRSAMALARRASATHEQARSLIALGSVTAARRPNARAASLLRRGCRLLDQVGAKIELQHARDLLRRAE